MNNCLIFTHLLLGPRRCAACQATAGEDGLCPGCRARLAAERLPATGRCPRCARALPTRTAPVACGSCQHDPPPFERVITAGSYASPLRELVWRLKFRQQLHAASVLGRLLADAVRAAGGPLPERLVPVPLHRRRLQRRGFNQSLEIARVSARRLGNLPVDNHCLVRQRATATQSRLARAARAGNLRGAFAVAAPLPAGCRVAAVDDVMTSGHTLRAFSDCLRRAGAGRVDAWVVARA
ncbi:MAG: ComF family protein [Gammaproteobacteria bacterium]|jgi:ComF family protein|nr:ComF family protein [Gammaproteobacteria bacterium]